MSFDSIMKEAGTKQYQIVWNPETNAPRVIPPKTGRDPEFERRLKASGPILTAGLKAPKHLKDSVKKASSEGWLNSANTFINDLRDKYLAPAMNAVGGGLDIASGLPNVKTLEGKTGDDPFGKNVADLLVPSSITGKAINASMLVQPESAALRMVIPALVGGATGALSGEGGLSGAAQGGLAGVAGEIPSAVTGAKQVGRYFNRGELTRQLYDDPVPAQKLSEIFNLKSFKEMINKGELWPRAIKDLRASREVQQRFGKNWDDIMLAIKEESLSKGKAIQKAFMDKLKVPFNPRKGNYSEGLWADYHKARQEAAEVVSEGRQLINAMRKARGMGRKVFDPAGKMKPGIASYEAGQQYNTLKSQIEQKLQSSFPKQADAYKANDDEYALFMSLRDLVNKTNPVTEDGRHVDLDKINRYLDKNPAPTQSRVKEHWDDLRGVFRRGAEAPGFDQPGALGRMRVHSSGSRAYVGAPLEAVGGLLTGKPMVSKPVGTVPGLLPKQSPVKPGLVPRLVTGGGAQAATDETTQSAP